MNQILSIILIVGCASVSFGQPIVFQNKLYLLDNKVYIPKILEERAALINYFNVDKEYVEEKNEYVLMFSVSDVFSTKIKYCILGDTVLIALSTRKVIYDEKIIHALPMFVAIPIKSIEPITESSIREYVIERKGAPYSADVRKHHPLSIYLKWLMNHIYVKLGTKFTN